MIRRCGRPKKLDSSYNNHGRQAIDKSVVDPFWKSWWYVYVICIFSHYWTISGDKVRCLHCNKEVRRGKEGCSTREASNSGMASHMRSKHSGEAIQVVILTFTLNSWKIHSSQVQQRLNAARRSSTELNEDKKDETVRGSLPLFKLRSQADREAWRKLVMFGSLSGMW